MYILNITKAIKKFSVNEITDFIFETYYKQIGFSKENSHYSMKWCEKKDFLLHANKFIVKKYLILVILRKKSAKSVKQ